VRALAPDAEETASLLNQFVERAATLLKGHEPANMLTLRGLAKHPPLPSIAEVCNFRPAAIAAYPMYRGLAKLVGMQVIPTGSSFTDEVETLRAHWDEHDFFFLHYKPADSAGEDGDFQAKIRALEDVDTYIDALHDLQAEVFMVAGDHSTPAVLAGHSWHPVPFLFHGKRHLRADPTEGFNERACQRGVLGTFPASEVLSLAMASSGRLNKYGA
jgi:2,3-bisphosphoglycerate-independent phosphoglycerate mutase